MSRALTASSSPPTDVLAVIVIYNCPLRESESYRSYSGALDYAPECARRSGLLLYDNSPASQDIGPAPATRSWYEHNPANGGIAAAYNKALEIAKQHSIPWLLLMDQDTDFPLDFLTRSFSELAQYSDDESIAAIVPRVRCRDSELSPKQVKVGRLSALPAHHTGVCDFEITAINSGTLLRTEFMKRVGGFNTAFWLDFLDYWLFFRIYESGARAAVSECNVVHRLSMAYPGQIGEERYQNILRAESAFVKQYRGRVDLCFYLLRLLVRSAKQLVLLSRPRLARLTLGIFVDTLSRPRAGQVRGAKYDAPPCEDTGPLEH